MGVPAETKNITNNLEGKKADLLERNLLLRIDTRRAGRLMGKGTCCR